VRAEELTSAVKRLIQGEEGIIPALRLVEAADIGDELAEQLKGLIEKRRIRFLFQAKADGADVDMSDLSYETEIADTPDRCGQGDQRHSPGNAKAILGRRKDPHCP